MSTSEAGTFAALLKRYRVAAGLTQEELAERARLSVRGLSNLERGVRHLPQHATINLLVEALHLTGADRATFEAAARAHSVLSPTIAQPQLGSLLPPLVGRTRELAVLERLLAGEPGIGKTRLLQEALQHAEGSGWTVLSGGCQRRGGQEPYTPLLEALARYIQEHSPTQLRVALQGCAWLVRLLPELAAGPIEPLPAWTLPPEQERRLMYAAVGHFLAHVAGAAGALLVLDDLQWAGPDALDLLATVVRSATVPLRVVGAYRSAEVRPAEPLAVTLVDLARAGLAAQHTLGPLTPAEAQQLLAGLLAGVEVTASVRARLVERTAGLPFYLVSCARGLRAGAVDAAAAARLPWDLTQSLRQRMADLPKAAQEVLGVAAVAGRTVPRALLTAVVARPEGELLAALEAICRAQLLEEEGEEAYHFLHDVTREVAEADLGAARRMSLHRRVAEVLEAGAGEPPSELLAYHYSRSEAQDKAVLYLEWAGDRAAAQHANAVADDHYRAAVQRLERLGRVLDVARVREKLGAVLRTVARYDEALAVLKQTAEAYRAAGDREGVHRTLAQIGQVHAGRGTAEEGVRHLQAVLETVDTHEPSHGLAALYAALAHLYFAGGRTGEQLAAAERAVELARVVRDDRILADAQNRRGLALFMLGRMEEAQRVLEEAILLAEATGDLDNLSRVLTNMTNVYSARGEFDQTRRSATRALEVAERRGDAAQVVFAALSLAVGYFFAGDWTQAGLHMEQALALSREIGASRVVAPPLVQLGWLCLAEGAWDNACRYLEEGLTWCERSADNGLLRQAHTLLAEREILEGRPDAARARLAPLLAGADQAFWGSAFVQATLAWAHLELGEVAAADEVVGQAVAGARAVGYRYALVEALRVRAMIATRRGCSVDAERSLEEALSLARSMPYPYAEGRLLHVGGQLHAQKGEPAPARERLEAALAIFRRLGACKDVERVEQAIAVIP